MKTEVLLGREVIPRRGLRREDAARYVGVSATKFDQLIKGEQMPAGKRLGGVVLWDIRALDLAFDALWDQDAEINEWDDI